LVGPGHFSFERFILKVHCHGLDLFISAIRHLQCVENDTHIPVDRSLLQFSNRLRAGWYQNHAIFLIVVLNDSNNRRLESTTYRRLKTRNQMRSSGKYRWMLEVGWADERGS